MEEENKFSIQRCCRNPLWIADFAYDGEFSDGNEFYLRIPEDDVLPFCNELMRAYADDHNGKVKVELASITLVDGRMVFNPGRVIRDERKRTSQWYDDVAENLSGYDLSEGEINGIAMDYELMAESARLADKYGINFLAVGSTSIPRSKERYRHGSLTGNWGELAQDIATSMLHNLQIREAVLMAVKKYRRFQKVLRQTRGEE